MLRQLSWICVILNCLSPLNSNLLEMKIVSHEFHLLFTAVYTRDEVKWTNKRSPCVSRKATRQVLRRKQNTTVTPVIHFAMIRDFVIRNYTEIYILQHYSSVYTRYFSMFGAIKIKRKGCAKVFLFPFCAIATQHEKIVSPPLNTKKKRWGGYAIDVVEMIFWHTQFARRKNCKNVWNHFSCVKHFAFYCVIFARLFILLNKAKHNFFLYLTLFNPLPAKWEQCSLWADRTSFSSTTSPDQKYPTRVAGEDGDLLCFLMRENFLIIFIQIFLINSLIFWANERGSRWRANVIKLFY